MTLRPVFHPRASVHLILVLLFSVVPVTSFADTATADSRITTVTVYSDRAFVTRTASSELTAGEHILTFENLPSALVDRSLQASGLGVAGASILDVTATTVFAEESVNERVKAVEDQIRNIKVQRRVLEDRAQLLEEQRAFVKRMLDASTSVQATGLTPVAARPTLDEWQRLYTYSEETIGKIAAERQSIDSQKEELQAKQTLYEQQLREWSGARGKQSKTVKVRVQLTATGRLNVSIRYEIPNAGWSPAYDARLRSSERAVDLTYFGFVRNGTGEDWNDIALTLSTARPSLGGGAPELRPWIADVARPKQANANAALSSSQTRDLPMVGNNVSSLTNINPDMVGEVRMILGPVDSELGRGNASVAARKGAAPQKLVEASSPSAEVESSITSATFKVPGKVTVAGNSITQKVAIKENRLMANLQFQSTPKLLEAAFLIANTTNDGDYPLLAGPMNTFLDDTFVANSFIRTVMPGEKFDLALGVDEGISVKRRLVNRFSEDTGLTNKSRKVTFEILVTLTNNKTTAEKIAFREPTPISHDEKIVVKVMTPQEKEIGTMANPKDVTREEDGKLVWRVNLKPGEKREFSLRLSIEYPGDISISGLE
jgi:hypothetical protein